MFSHLLAGEGRAVHLSHQGSQSISQRIRLLLDTFMGGIALKLLPQPLEGVNGEGEGVDEVMWGMSWGLGEVGKAGVEGKAPSEDGVQDMVGVQTGEQVLLIFREVTVHSGVAGSCQEPGVQAGDQLRNFLQHGVLEAHGCARTLSQRWHSQNKVNYK